MIHDGVGVGGVGIDLDGGRFGGACDIGQGCGGLNAEDMYVSLVAAPTRGRSPWLVWVNSYQRAEHPMDIDFSQQSEPVEGIATQNHFGAMSRRRMCSTPNRYAMLPMAPSTRKRWEPMLLTTSSPLSEAFSLTYR